MRHTTRITSPPSLSAPPIGDRIRNALISSRGMFHFSTPITSRYKQELATCPWPPQSFLRDLAADNTTPTLNTAHSQAPGAGRQGV